MRRYLTICSLLAVGSLASALGCADRSMWTAKDSWYAPATAWKSNDGFRAVPYVAVPKDRISEATQRLESVSAVALTRDEATQYVGVLPPSMDNTPLFLVRGLSLDGPTTRLTVESDGTTLRVHKGSMGHHARPMTRQPLVVTLERTPSKVAVSVSMIE